MRVARCPARDRSRHYTEVMRQQIRFCQGPGGTSIAYAVSGRGAPVVRVGNWLTHVEYDWRSPVRRHWLEAFSREHTLIRYDLRGSGLSERHPQTQGLDVWVEDLRAVLDDLGVERAPMLASCQGGAISVAFAARYPERVSRLILFGSYGCGGLARGQSGHAAEEANALARMIEVGWGKDVPAFRELFCRLLMPDAPASFLAALAELQRRTASPREAVRLWRAFHEVDVLDEATKVTAPTLVFHVRGDGMVPFDAGLRLASLIPSARFVPIEGRNHILREDESGWREFSQQALEFLAQDEGAVPARAFPDLTPRERAVLEQVARGLTNGEIAEALFVTPKTVRNYISRIFAKLGVGNRAQAIVMAREAGLGRARRRETADSSDDSGHVSLNSAH